MNLGISLANGIVQFSKKEQNKISKEDNKFTIPSDIKMRINQKFQNSEAQNEMI